MTTTKHDKVTPLPTAEDQLATQKAEFEKEYEQRKVQAQQCANALSTLMLGEVLNTSTEATVMAVHGGWIFTSTHKAGITSTFVPQPPRKPSTVQTPPAIII